MDSPIKILSLDLLQLNQLASELVKSLPRPMVIGLTGTLGAGKTTLVQGIARASGIDAADVTSPTFTLLQTHRGSIVLHHLDAYRLADEEEFLQLGVDELFEDPESWTLIEWADRVRDVLPPQTLWIELVHGQQQDTRDVIMQTNLPDIQTILERIQQHF